MVHSGHIIPYGSILKQVLSMAFKEGSICAVFILTNQ